MAAGRSCTLTLPNPTPACKAEPGLSGAHPASLQHTSAFLFAHARRCTITTRVLTARTARQGVRGCVSPNRGAWDRVSGYTPEQVAIAVTQTATHNPHLFSPVSSRPWRFCRLFFFPVSPLFPLAITDVPLGADLDGCRNSVVGLLEAFFGVGSSCLGLIWRVYIRIYGFPGSSPCMGARLVSFGDHHHHAHERGGGVYRAKGPRQRGGCKQVGSVELAYTLPSFVLLASKAVEINQESNHTHIHCLVQCIALWTPSRPHTVSCNRYQHARYTAIDVSYFNHIDRHPKQATTRVVWSRPPCDASPARSPLPAPLPPRPPVRVCRSRLQQTHNTPGHAMQTAGCRTHCCSLDVGRALLPAAENDC
ncbi:hypothetical protein B0I37DRAFT_76464 [Chaetomium sp. MPI-CAGE-AT-0009]|nr:hypothetical protein B0I37DRAFT_76464 [Chaetomium sp. MPI-CAGE-AT-0009]